MNFELGPDERVRTYAPAARGSSIGVMLLILMVGACAGLAAASALGYKFSAVLPNFSVPDHDFTKLYARYAMSPIPAPDLDQTMYQKLIKLEGEPCDGVAATALGKALSAADDKRLAASFFLGFSAACAHDPGSERFAANLFFNLSDFKPALQYSTDLTVRFPENSNDWYLRGKSEEQLGLHDDALQSYATMIQLVTDKSKLGEWVFYEMARMYAAKGQFCEAMTPIDTYVSLDPARRDTSRPQQVISDYSKRGHCTRYAKGEASFPVLDNNVINVRAAINGVTGTFAVDTGASFVTVTPGFAEKAGIKTSGTINSFTANGDAEVKLSKATTIVLGGLRATDVPLVVVSKPIGQVDGLLGRSLLARYEMSIDRHRLMLTSKAAP